MKVSVDTTSRHVVCLNEGSKVMMRCVASRTADQDKGAEVNWRKSVVSLGQRDGFFKYYSVLFLALEAFADLSWHCLM